MLVPGIGEHVMVSYEYGDTNRPFVTGSLFHVRNTKGVVNEKGAKSICTRSGHMLEFNDDESGNWGITIKDKEGNIMRFDTKNKNIEISTPESLTLNAKNLNIKTTEDITIEAGAKLNLDVKDEASIAVNSNANINVKNSLNTNSKEYQLFSDSVVVASDGELTLDGSTVTKVSGKKMEIQGGSNKLELL